MDPNEALRLLRTYVKKVAKMIDEGSHFNRKATFIDTVSGLADTTCALDNWLSKGGALPDDWKWPR